MRIVCPSCEAVYQVPDATLAKVRVMRCARCAQVFEPPAVEAAMDEPVPEPEPAFAPEPEIEHSLEPVIEPPPPPRPWPTPPIDAATEEDRVPVPMATRLAVLAAWAVSLAAVASIIVLGIVDRQQVVHAWPASARLYAALGLKL